MPLHLRDRAYCLFGDGYTFRCLGTSTHKAGSYKPDSPFAPPCLEHPAPSDFLGRTENRFSDGRFIDKNNHIPYLGTLYYPEDVRVKKRLLGVSWGLIMGLGMSPAGANSDLLVQQVMLSREITDRNPEHLFSPPAYCEKDKNGKAAIPVVPAAQASQVVLWTKVESTVTGTIRHTWHHKVQDTWRTVSSVNLAIRPSSGFRTWSIHTIRPNQDLGEWMVVVAPSIEPDRILCITRFSVQ